MSTWAIVPVKPFIESKSRLAPVLSPVEREALCRNLLARTLDVVKRVPGLANALVVSRDVDALRMAREAGVQALAEASEQELNAALAQAVRAAREAGAEAVLVLPADLPLLEPSDLEAVLAAERDNCVVICPDRRSEGTNALFLRPPDVLNPAFGPGSFERHLALARAADVEPRVCRRPGMELDVDLPDDWQVLTQLGRHGANSQRLAGAASGRAELSRPQEGPGPAASGQSPERLQPNSRYCFVCGVENAYGLRLKFHNRGADGVETIVTIPDHFQGYPGVAHGGIVAALLDEIAGRTPMIDDPQHFMMTVTMEVKYRLPVPTGQPLRLAARRTKSRGRLAAAHAELHLPDGRVAAEAEVTLADLPSEMREGLRPEEGLGWRVYEGW